MLIRRLPVVGIIDVKVNFRLLLVLKRTHWALTQDGIPGHFQVSSFDVHRQIVLDCDELEFWKYFLLLRKKQQEKGT